MTAVDTKMGRDGGKSPSIQGHGAYSSSLLESRERPRFIQSEATHSRLVSLQYNNAIAKPGPSPR
jgi:hypothetical protein